MDRHQGSRLKVKQPPFWTGAFQKRKAIPPKIARKFPSAIFLHDHQESIQTAIFFASVIAIPPHKDRNSRVLGWFSRFVGCVFRWPHASRSMRQCPTVETRKTTGPMMGHWSGLCFLGGGFKYFLFSSPIWGRIPIWLIFFKWVETTN